MPFSELDTAAVARSLSQVADRQDDIADAYFECLEEVEVPPADESAGVRVRREQGFALRLIRDGRTWLASRDQIEAAEFTDALRQIARVMPAAPYSSPNLRLGPAPELESTSALLHFPLRVTEAIRRGFAAFPLRLRMRRHKRWLRVVGTHVAPDQEAEAFFSYEAETPWSRQGGLLVDLGEEAAETLARRLTSDFRAREAPPVEPGPWPLVLGPGAAAVLLHEAVAHALETDTLALGGKIEAALGVEIGSDLLNVLDNPSGGPETVRRQTDDEGMRVVQRWLLRGGAVEQVLADLFTAHHSPDLIAGSGRRGDRHLAPVPRSTHLELLGGESTLAELIAGLRSGLYFSEASRGALDPLSGEFSLRLSGGRQIDQGELSLPVAPCGLRGKVSDLLGAVDGIGVDRVLAGAGWCAKGGIRLPVWATTPPLRLSSAEVIP